MASMWGIIQDIPEAKKPEDIINEQFEELSALTDGYVIGRVDRYERTISEMSTSQMLAVTEMMKSTMVASPQQYLGEISKEAAINFEAYVTIKVFPNYKYRFLFLQHGIVPYPATVELEKDISDSIGEDKTTFVCQDEHEFIVLLEKVLKSERVMLIISRLAAYRN